MKEQVWHSGKYNPAFKHGMRKTTTYKVWCDMKSRCDNPKHIHFDKYGGRGIKYCDKWKTFLGFFEDMGVRPKLTFLDRQNNDLGYSKDNCKWVSSGESMFNKRTSNRNGLPRGVLRSDSGFKSTIRIQGKAYHIGCFPTKELASTAYLTMCLEWYGKIPPEKL